MALKDTYVVHGKLLESLEISNRASTGLWSNRSYQKGAVPQILVLQESPRQLLQSGGKALLGTQAQPRARPKVLAQFLRPGRYLVTSGCEE